MLPEIVGQLVKMKVNVKVESGAGSGSMISDDDYKNAGASISTKEDIFQSANLITRINSISKEDIRSFRADIFFVSVSAGACPGIEIRFPGRCHSLIHAFRVLLKPRSQYQYNPHADKGEHSNDSLHLQDL